MPKVTLTTLTSSYGSIDSINSNFDTIETAFDNTLSRDGSSPNTMNANIDLNGFKIINSGTPTNNADLATKAYVDTNVGTAVSSAAAAATSAANAATSASNAATSATASANSATAAAASASSAATSATNAAASAATASTFSSMGLGGAVAFDFGSVADAVVVFPTDWGLIV